MKTPTTMSREKSTGGADGGRPGARVCRPQTATHSSRLRMTPRARLDDLALLLVVSIPFLFLKLGMPLLDPDEGLYAAIAQEMLSRADWVIPHVNGLPYLEKPPLYFWLTAATMWLVGPTEWA